MNADPSHQRTFVASIDGGEDNAQRFQRVLHFLECGRRFHTRKTPIGIEHYQMRCCLAFWQHMRIVIPRGDGQFMENANVLIKIESMPEKINKIRLVMSAAHRLMPSNQIAYPKNSSNGSVANRP